MNDSRLIDEHGECICEAVKDSPAQAKLGQLEARIASKFAYRSNYSEPFDLDYAYCSNHRSDSFPAGRRLRDEARRRPPPVRPSI